MDTKNLLTGITLTIVGMGVVFLALFFLDMVIRLTGLLLGAHRSDKAAPAEETAPPAAVPAEAAESELAAIMAAVAATLTEPVRIHHIRMLRDEQQAAWSRIGRLDIMRSHSSGHQG
jgi:sodium pump decarboxylase gamma subunit